MPAYFQGKFIVGDWVRGRIWVLDVDATGTLLNVEALRPDDNGNALEETNSPIDFAMGPGGVLYVLYTGGRGYGGWNSGGSIKRYEYNGTHYTAESCGDKIVQNPVVSVPEIAAKALPQTEKIMFHLNGTNNIIPIQDGVRKISLFNVNGKVVFTSRVSKDQGSVNLPNDLNQGIFFLKFDLE